jgi:hypothetical protein
MTRALYVVHSRPSSPDKEDAYNDWYDNVHLKDVCSVPGVVGARRYKVADTQTAGGLPPYVAIYEFDCENPQDAIDAIMAGVAEGRFAMSDALQTDPMPVIDLYLER